MHANLDARINSESSGRSSQPSAGSRPAGGALKLWTNTHLHAPRMLIHLMQTHFFVVLFCRIRQLPGSSGGGCELQRCLRAGPGLTFSAAGCFQPPVLTLLLNCSDLSQQPACLLDQAAQERFDPRKVKIEEWKLEVSHLKRTKDLSCVLLHYWQIFTLLPHLEERFRKST